MASETPSMKAVVYPTKVRIFLQITTAPSMAHLNWMLLFTLQRYEFFCKSQPNRLRPLSDGSCCLPYKGTNFSANHNEFITINSFKKAVVYPTKVRIFLQITTVRLSSFHRGLLLFTLQRYEFFCKSQRSTVTTAEVAGCCLPYKGTNFSANHNLFQAYTSR